MIPYGRQTIDEEDIRAVADVLRGDWLTQGPKVAEFEKALAGYCGAKHAVVYSNGSVALQAAYAAAGLGPGHELVTTPLTFAATATAALWLGARPVFADIKAGDGNLDPEKAAAAITAKTKILAPVDYSGRPVDLAAFKAIAKKHKLLLVEDACHALGASYEGRKIGSHADLTVFSFHPVKSITTGEGGAVLTDDDAFAEKLLSYRTHGVTKKHPDWRYEIGELAQNGRLTDMQCALGLSQLKKLDSFVERRAEHASAYSDELAGVDEIVRPPAAEAGGSAWHLYPIRLRLDRLSAGRAEFYAELRARGVGAQVHYIPVYHHPLYRGLGYQGALCPVAESFYEAQLSLPIFPTLSDADRRKVVSAVKATAAKFARAARTAP